MKIEHLRIVNFQSIDRLDLELAGNSVLLLGKNGVGKSSVISAVFSALTGKTPEKMLKAGSFSGAIEIRMTDFVVKGDFNAKKNTWSSFSVETLEGAAYRSPREFLKQQLGTIDFDVNQFLRDTPKKQIEFVKQLTGIDFTELEEAYKQAYDERTFVNRRVKEVEAQQQTFDMQLATTAKTVDLADLNRQLIEANTLNSRISEGKRIQLQNNDKIISLQNELDALRRQQSSINKWLEENHLVDTDPLIKKIATINETNAAIDRAANALAKKKEMDQLHVQQDQLNIRLEEIQEKKLSAIASCKMPVPGMTFDDDSLYIDGIPFAQVNTARRIIAGLQMQLPLMNEVRICSFDASLLDDDNLAQVQAWAKANDLQLFIERVERNQEGLKIEILEQPAALAVAS